MHIFINKRVILLTTESTKTSYTKCSKPVWGTTGMFWLLLVSFYTVLNTFTVNLQPGSLPTALKSSNSNSSNFLIKFKCVTNGIIKRYFGDVEMPCIQFFFLGLYRPQHKSYHQDFNSFFQ